jgi:hypothetical protein
MAINVLIILVCLRYVEKFQVVEMELLILVNSATIKINLDVHLAVKLIKVIIVLRCLVEFLFVLFVVTV